MNTSPAELIPHGPGMSLIDRVVDHDRDCIHCRTRSHASADNPLTENGVLSSVAIIEYASQAAAIHAALAGSGFGQGRPAYIGMVKSVRLHRARLSDIEGDIELKAECILSQDGGAVYRFEAYCEIPIADGRLNLVKPG